jgi:hypothetical protein
LALAIPFIFYREKRFGLEMDASTQTEEETKFQETIPSTGIPSADIYDKLVKYVSELKNETSYWKGYLNGYRNGSQGQPSKVPATFKPYSG